MAIYFLDLSAVVKRYFPEQGHNWVRNPSRVRSKE